VKTEARTEGSAGGLLGRPLFAGASARAAASRRRRTDVALPCAASVRPPFLRFSV